MTTTALAIAMTLLGSIECATTLDETVATIVRHRQSQGVYEPEGQVGAVEYVIPVTLHVIRESDGTGGQDPALALSMLAEVNAAFANAGFTFLPLGPVRFLDNSGYLGGPMQATAIWTTDNVADTVNVYFGSGYSGVCGVAALSAAETRGVLLNDICNFGAPIAPSVLAHELGHYFDLLHTHETALGAECPDGSNCADAGDLVCDTPADPNLLARVGADCIFEGGILAPCHPPQAYAPDTRNLMSYAPQLCIEHFTQGQEARMQASLLTLQPELALQTLPDLQFDPVPGVLRTSVSSGGQQANTGVWEPEISGDGRYVVFRSFSGTLVAEDENFQTDVFRHDRLTGATIRISVNNAGVETDSRGDGPSVSADGRYVSFSSFGTNLVPGNPGDYTRQIYLRDVDMGRTMAVSRRADGVWGDAHSHVPQVSDDGRRVVFFTDADSLVPGAASPWGNLLLKDLDTDVLEVINVDEDGVPRHDFLLMDSVITGDGRFVAFTTRAALVGGDANGRLDAYLRDTVDGVTELLSVNTRGEGGTLDAVSVSISDDGRYAVFHSAAGNLDPADANGSSLTDVFLRDRLAGTTRRISVASDGTAADGHSTNPRISRDGRFVVFVSHATNLSTRDTGAGADVYRHDLQTGHTVLVSRRASDAATSGGAAESPAISGDGAIAVFGSAAADIVPVDVNSATDVFAVAVAEVLAADGDVNGDGSTDVDDLVAAVLAWGQCPDTCPQTACPADLDGNCVVDVNDLVAVIVNWSS